MTTIPSERLTENTYIIVDGYVDYSRVTSLIEGEELERRNENRMFAITRPHTTISLRDSRIRPASGDPENLSLEELFVLQSFYDSVKDENKKNVYSIDNKSEQLPALYVPRDPSNLAEGYDQLTNPAGELDRGLSATLVLQVYKPKNYEKRGIGLRAVIINEQIRYYSSGLDVDQLQGMGITLGGPAKFGHNDGSAFYA